MGTDRGVLVVVGGGVVGLACAVRLQERGWRTTVIDPDAEPFAASWGNAGHVALEQVEPLASPATVRSAARRLFALGGALDLPIRAAPTWGPWAIRYLKAATPGRFEAGKRALGALMSEAGGAWTRLTREIGAGDLYAETGHLVLWESARTAAAGRRAWASADTGASRFEDLGPGMLEWIGVRLKARLAGGIRFSGTGRIRDLHALRARLQAALRERGGTLEQGEAAALVQDGGRIAVILRGGGRLTPDRVLVAAGARSRRLMAGAGHRVPLIAERGYHLHDPNADWPEDLSPLVFEDRAVIMNRFADGVRISSFVEFARPDTPPDRRKWGRLRRHAAELGLPIGPDAREWMGARPTLPDYLPAIGVSRRPGGVAYAFGHQHLGLTLAAVTAEAVSAALCGSEPAVDLAPFDVERFG
jgi:D-amino-acid dehydrogenase